MDSIDYLITAHGVIERGLFYNYMHDLGFKDNINFTREYMVNNDYPFGVCLKKKKLMVIESAPRGCGMGSLSNIMRKEEQP